MIDPAMFSDVHPPMDLSVEAQPVPDGMDLERRVQRLETEINGLKDTKALEERIAARVTEQLQKATPSEQFMASAARSTTAGHEPLASSPEVPARERGSYAWLLLDVLDDARLLLRMLLDKHYILAWTTHVVVLVCIFAILTSNWWFPAGWLPVVGGTLDKILDLILAFCVYKTLSRELRRYREILLYRR